MREGFIKNRETSGVTSVLATRVNQSSGDGHIFTLTDTRTDPAGISQRAPSIPERPLIDTARTAVSIVF